MSDYLDIYTKKVGSSGNSIHESIVNNTQYYIQSKFKDSPTYRRAKFYHRKNNVFTQGEIDIRVLEISRMGSIRNILLRPNENLDIGNILIFDDAEWLAFDKYGSLNDNYKLTVGRINDKIKWRDANGVLHEVPCISGTSYLGSKSRQNRYDIEYNTYDVRLPIGQIFVFSEYNEETKLIDLNKRFIFGDKVYEVTGVDNVTYLETDGYGIVQYTLKITTKRTDDDFVNRIASNNYDIEDKALEEGGELWGWQ